MLVICCIWLVSIQNIGVFLMGHDARTGREGIGQFNEGEVLRIVQTGVECQFSESRGNRCDSGGYDTLGFPSSH